MQNCSNILELVQSFIFCFIALYLASIKTILHHRVVIQKSFNFCSLTSFPAIFYAIPVERFFDIDTAGTINIYFLLVVAVWRVALLIFYLRRFACLTRVQTTIATLLPLTVIVTTLTTLNLERAVFNIMGGIREKTSNDEAYGILFLLTTLSILLIVPIIIGYGAIIYLKYQERRLFKKGIKNNIKTE